MNKKAQSGVSLVELMIALVIGLFLVAGVLTIFTSNKQTYLYQQSQGVEDEYQRLAATVFGVMLRQAGHSTMTPEALQGKEAVFTYVHDTSNSLSLPTGQVISGYENSTDDVIKYRFMGGPGIFGCDGKEISDPATLRHEELQFISDGILQCHWFMKDMTGANVDDSGVFDLIGDGLGVSASQRLTVTALDITYGVVTSGTDSSIDRYMTAAQVNTVPTGSTENHWRRVKSAVIEMTMQSGNREPVTMKYAVEFPNLIGAL